jgi:hypothetical protein
MWNNNALIFTGNDRAATIREMYSPTDLNMKLIINNVYLVLKLMAA